MSLTPARHIVQVGMPVTFEAHAANLSNVTYSWCRASGVSAECVALPAVHGPTYTIAGTAMPDDGAWFRVTANGTEGTAMSNFSTLHVSSMAPVVMEDGEFAETDWAVASETSAAEGAPTFSTARVAEGGNPGAYLSGAYTIPSTAGSTFIFHTRLPATYDPTSQGAVYLIDLSMECTSMTPLTWVAFGPMFEQGGRRFANDDPRTFGFGAYCSDGWRRSGGLLSWRQVSGPACGPGESCPDFSASAPPLRFGFMVAERSLGGAAQTVTYRYDNWKVSIWRR